MNIRAARFTSSNQLLIIQTLRMASCRGVALVCALGVLAMFGVTTATPANAQQFGGLPALEKRVAALEAIVVANMEQIAALKAALLAENSARQAAESALANRAEVLEEKTQFMSVEGTELYITGANVHIRNGLGATNGNPDDPRATAPETTAVNGLGNLTIGYNAEGGIADFPRSRGGSHYLILGDYNYYSAFGGIAAGRDNSALGPYASTLGGRSNRAPGSFSSVVGGAFNLTDGNTASILGGDGNRASDIDATVSGGAGNHASARFSSISGGAGIVQNVEYGWSAGVLGPAIQGSFSSP